MIFLTASKTEAKEEIARREKMNRFSQYEIRKHESGYFGLWVTYTNCNYKHWAREM